MHRSMISRVLHSWKGMEKISSFRTGARIKQRNTIPAEQGKYNPPISLPKLASKLVGVITGSIPGRTNHTIDMMRHEGIFHDVFSIEAFRALDRLPRLLIIIAPVDLEYKDIARLRAHVEIGNGLIVIGKVLALESLLGIMYKVPDFPFPVGGRGEDSIGEGYAHPSDDALASSLPAGWWPLHAFGCAPVLCDGASILAAYETVHPSSDAWAAITVNTVGRGSAVQVAVDISRTTRLVQEGRYVDQDGIPPPDGLSPVDDGILKCEDGLVLDWTRDRRLTSPSCKVAAFMVPVADAWRKVMMACIETIADACAIPVKRAWYWPGGAEFIGLISHDSDGNDERLARYLLAEIGRAGIHTTWCVEAPGYSREMCTDIQAAGHEIALHFDAIAYPAGKQQDAAGMARLFSRDMLARQLDEVRRKSGCASIYSNKNHYTRWAGRTAFFEWCEALGLRVDQSKGPSKCGTLGFPFGSCHPWQPTRDDGTLIGCCEIGFQSQDFGLQGPADTIDDILDAVKRANGVAHVIFHPAHAKKDGVNKSMHEFITRAKQLGAVFMTSKEIAEWTFDRKNVIATGDATLAGLVVHERDPGRHAWVLVDEQGKRGMQHDVQEKTRN